MNQPAGRRLEVKLAKASKSDILVVTRFFQMLEEVIEYGNWTPRETGVEEPVDDERFLELIRELWNEYGPGVGASWGRVVHGCDLLIDNCCDPESDVLEWRKDVREWLESQQEVVASEE